MNNKIAKLKSLLDGKRPLSKSAVDRLYKDFSIEFTYNSNAIEGSTITHNETYRIIAGGITVDGKSFKEHLDTYNLYEAIIYVRDLVNEGKILDEKLIKELHTIVLNNDIEHKGRYRREIVSVGTHKPVEPYHVPSLMEKLIEKYNKWILSSRDIVEIITEFHANFEHIHPFFNGNGRTGRLIINYELIKAGYPPIDIKFSDRNRYYKALNEFDNTGDISKLQELVEERMIDSLQHHLNAIESRDKCEELENEENEI